VKVIKAPQELDLGWFNIFLAGSIEMGKAEDWQTRVTNALSDLNCVILNPRRDDWDSSWEQKITNPQFKEQVQWELRALEQSDLIVMYFDPATMSPISLLELGLHAKDSGEDRHPELIVCCPEGFWRKGNVDIVCERYGVKQVNMIEDLIAEIRNRLD
jgi:hypothetical protein